MNHWRYDLYAEYGANTREGLERLRKDSSLQADWHIALLASVTASEKIKEMGLSIYRDHVRLLYEREVLRPGLDMLGQLGLEGPGEFPIAHLPLGAWILRFRFTLARAYISRDDEVFYPIENPVRKDKVFKVPFCSGASWKGNLRWTAMKWMVDRHSAVDPAHGTGGKAAADHVREFAEERFELVRLFGSEKGEEPRTAKDLARYLNGLSNEAAVLYRAQVRRHCRLKENEPMPNHRGRLLFYPTFFDKIGLEVINPHDRKRGVGTQPIYFECVPTGAKGIFSLLYVPFDLLGNPPHEIETQAKADLLRTAEGIREMFLTYGFSAKKSSGFGTAEPTIEDGQLRATWLDTARPLASLQTILEDVKHG